MAALQRHRSRYSHCNKLTKKILAVLVHVRRVPEKVALLVDLVEDLEALGIGFRFAVEGTLAVGKQDQYMHTALKKKRTWLAPTHQAHCAITNPIDLRSVLAEFGGRQLARTGDSADGFFDFVHCGGAARRVFVDDV